MRYFKLFTTGVMLFTAFQAVRGTVLFHTTEEHHNFITAQTIGSMSLTSVACLLTLISIWNYRAILREEKENA
jgi:hypothetical protein